MKSAKKQWESIEYLALSRMRLILLERLRAGQIPTEDLTFVSQVIQPLVYGSRANMAAALNLTPRALRRIFNDAGKAGPQLRREMFEAYLRGVQAQLKGSRPDANKP